jgi:hypothetical protein
MVGIESSKGYSLEQATLLPNAAASSGLSHGKPGSGFEICHQLPRP